MKKLLVFIATSMTAFAAATTNELGQILVPSDKPVPIQWTAFPEEPNYSFKLWSGTNEIATLTTNQFRVIGASDDGTIYVWTNTFAKGTSALSLTIIGELAGTSDRGKTSAWKALGKPAPPGAPSKP